MKDFIRTKVRQLLSEREGATYSYGCVMLYFDIPKKKWDKIQGLIEDEDISNTNGEGRENEPHVTILYGIHGDVPDEDVKELAEELTAPEITLKEISLFENEDVDVVKFEIDCPALEKMNKKFKELPHTSTFKDYKPHTTIAFLKAGTGKKYKQTLEGDDVMKLKPSKIVYSKPDGTKKEYKFKEK